MKIIDEKGMLFRKINVIDFLAILFLLFFVPIFYFANKLIGKEKAVTTVETPKEYIEIERDYKLIKVKPGTLELIHMGDKEIDETGETIGEITWLGETKPYIHRFDLGSGEFILKEDPGLKQVSSRLKLKMELKNTNLFYKNKQITISNPIEFRTKDYTVLAIPSIDEKKEATKLVTLDVNAVLKDLDNDTVKLVSIGDKEIDKDGKISAEIIKTGKIMNNAYDVNLGAVNIVLGEDINKKQVFVKLRLNCEITKDGNLFFKNQEIKYNSLFDFKTQEYVAQFNLVNTSIDEKKEATKLVTLDVNAVLKDLDNDTVKLVSIGDKEIDKDGKISAEIIKTGKIMNNAYDVNLGAGNVVLGEDINKKQVFVKLRLNCEITKDGNLFFKNQEIKYNSLFDFKTQEYVARVNLANALVDEKWVEVKVKFSAIIPELSKVIAEGNTEHDLDGRMIARIKTIESNIPTGAHVLSLEQNKFVTVPQPFFRDIVVIMNILCIEKDGVLYFKNSPVKMGNTITLTTDLYNIQGLIIGL